MPMKRRRGQPSGETVGGLARAGNGAALRSSAGPEVAGLQAQDGAEKARSSVLRPSHQRSNKANPAASDPCSVCAAQRREIMIVPLTNLPVPFQPIFQSLSGGSDILSLSQLINCSIAYSRSKDPNERFCSDRHTRV